MIRRIFWQSAVLLLLAAGAGALTGRYHPAAPQLSVVEETAAPGEITVRDALARGDVVWLDARPASEFAKGHIPGALLLNEYEWENLLPEVVMTLADPDDKRLVVIYCDAKKCAASKAVRERLMETPLGEREMLTLHGGWPAWQAAAP